MDVIDDPVVVVDSLVKQYEIPTYRTAGRHRKESVVALDQVNLVVRRGEAVGLLGVNGSGKSTLLNLISGAERPSAGRVLVNGKPQLLSVGAVLRDNLTGAQNAVLGLLAKGLSQSRAENEARGIADFTDLGDAFNRPLDTYSSGMRARLKFGIATTGNKDILLVDEALATGDASFTQKARERMVQHLGGAGTLFLVSHRDQDIVDNCSRAVWIHQGRVIADGEALEVTRKYRQWTYRIGHGRDEEAARLIEEATRTYVSPTIVYDSEC